MIRLQTRNFAILLLILSHVWIIPAGQSQTATFDALGNFATPVGRTNASAVSSGGPVIAGSVQTDQASALPYRWQSGTPELLNGALPNTSYGTANGVSANGEMIVGSVFTHFSPLVEEAFRWTSSGGMVALGDLPGGDARSSANAVSGDGAVIVGESNSATGRQAFRWTSGTGMVALGALSGGWNTSTARSVSIDGTIVVGRAFQASNTQAFRWTESDGMVGLGDLSGGDFRSSAEAISADGSVIAGYGYSAAGPEAFRWTAGTGMVGLGQLAGGTWSSATAVSEDGSLIGGESLYHAAFIWNEAHGMRNLQDFLTTDLGLDLSGWQLGYVSGISTAGDDVYVVGGGENPQGIGEAFLATIPKSALMPEPGCLAMLGILPLLLRRRARSRALGADPAIALLYHSPA